MYDEVDLITIVEVFIMGMGHNFCLFLEAIIILDKHDAEEALSWWTIVFKVLIK